MRQSQQYYDHFKVADFKQFQVIRMILANKHLKEDITNMMRQSFDKT